MFEQEQLISNLKKVGEKNTHCLVLKVDSVDTQTFTIQGTEISSNQVFYNVRIKSISDNVIANQFILIPAVGSYVFCVPGNNIQQNLEIVGVSEVSQIYLKGDANKGLVKVTELVDKINRLENKVNDLINALINHVHPVTAVGSPTGVSPALTGFPTITPLTAISDIENPTVKH